MAETLSIDEARKLVLLSQRLPYTPPTGSALTATLATVQHLGYIQIDTISVIERAHHHTLWNRCRRYQTTHIEQLLQQRKIYEYWAHAASYLPMADYRYSLPNMRAFIDGKPHWYTPERGILRQVLARITAEGPLRARDFAGVRHQKMDMWNWKPAKQALEQLFMEGKLMTARRHGFDKVYDLAERVLPADIDTRMPTELEYGRFLIIRFLQANGLGTPTETAYLRTGLKSMVDRYLKQMVECGEVVRVEVKCAAENLVYYTLPATLELLCRPLSRKRLKILSPFDNLLIQRKRMQQLFNFDYRIECYTPANKRVHGYFSLPILWRGRLVARMDCKADRKKSMFIVRNFFSEPSLRQKERLVDALIVELKQFATFNRCTQVVVGELHDKTIQTLLRSACWDSGNFTAS